MSPTPLQQHVLLQEDARERFAIHVHQPELADATHAVVLLPAIAGVNAYIAGRAAQLARAGYLVAVVDYFSRSASQPGRSIVRTRNRVVKQDGTVVMEYTPLRMVKCRQEKAA